MQKSIDASKLNEHSSSKRSVERKIGPLYEPLLDIANHGYLQLEEQSERRNEGKKAGCMRQMF